MQDAADATGSHCPCRVVFDVASVGIGLFRWEKSPRRLVWDAQMLKLFGYEPDDEPGEDEYTSRVHVADRAVLIHAARTAFETCGEFAVQYRVAHPDGCERWIETRGRVLPGPDGAPARMVGAAYDTTERQEGAAGAARVLESMPTAFLSMDRDWRITYVNAEAEPLLGHTRDEMLGADLWELFPTGRGTAFEHNYRHAMRTGEPVTFEAYYPQPLDRWYEVHAWPRRNGLAVYFLDVTSRHEAEQAASHAAARGELVARVTEQLSETLDAEEAVARLAQTVVPELADWCMVTLVDDERTGTSLRPRLRNVGSWHAEEELRPVVQECAALLLEDLQGAGALYRTLGDGRTVSVQHSATEVVTDALAPGDAEALVHRLAPESLSVLPMRARGRTVGALSLFNGAVRAPMTLEDLQTAEEVAGRAGLALDNARLYREQRRFAEELQRSLLSQPPQPDHVEITVRYQPATDAAQVGGDWYDAFVQEGGATVLVIGDVSGHDIQAAATMGQLRSIVRGVGVTTGAGPAQLLRRTDKALELLQFETIATAVVARLEQTPDERARGVTQVRWSNAGHPDPMVVNLDGTVVTLSAAHPDPLLGLSPDVDRLETSITLDRGATVVMYTDGLVERRDQGLQEGMVRLRDALVELAPRGLGTGDLCDELLRRLLPEDLSDDVALLAVRLHPQGEPRA